VRRRSGRKRAVGMRAPITIPQGPNQRWSLDFASDALGGRFWLLTIVDDLTRECRHLRLVRELDFLIAVRGCQGFRNCAQQFVQLSNGIVRRKRLLLMPNTGTITRKATSHSPN
jgi:hypothetical protein